MLAGLGTDIIEVDRIGEKIAKESGFRELVFSVNEIAYCESKANKYSYYAARFAAKEAFFKALGTGWTEGVQYNEVELSNEESGKPYFIFLGETKKTLSAWGIKNILVSVSHLKSIATAVVIIEK